MTPQVLLALGLLSTPLLVLGYAFYVAWPPRGSWRNLGFLSARVLLVAGWWTWRSFDGDIWLSFFNIFDLMGLVTFCVALGYLLPGSLISFFRPFVLLDKRFKNPSSTQTRFPPSMLVLFAARCVFLLLCLVPLPMVWLAIKLYSHPTSWLQWLSPLYDWLDVWGYQTLLLWYGLVVYVWLIFVMITPALARKMFPRLVKTWSRWRGEEEAFCLGAPNT